MNMKAGLSSLLDGEAEAREALAVFKALKRDPALRRDAEVYALIGDALRGEPGLSSSLAGRVMATLEQEPVVLAPRRAKWVRPAAALAAGVAGLAVVGAVVFLPAANGDRAPVANVAANMSPAEARQAAANMRDYLIAHQAHSTGAFVGGASQQIRTVSLVDRGGNQ